MWLPVYRRYYNPPPMRGTARCSLARGGKRLTQQYRRLRELMGRTESCLLLIIVVLGCRAEQTQLPVPDAQASPDAMTRTGGA